jgi:hypothetical protein
MVYLGLVLSDVQILNEFWLGPLVLVILPLSHERGFDGLSQIKTVVLLS